MSDSKAANSVSEQQNTDHIDDSDYQALELALTQTARGRGFLNEYLRRNGSAAEVRAAVEKPLPQGGDTQRILQAIEQLHEAIVEQQQEPNVAHVRMDIIEMARAIAKTRKEIAAMRTDGDYDKLTAASEEMDAIVQSTEKATNDILQMAERIQEIAWQLREAGTNEATCEEIDNCATEIYMSCSFQDLTGQRTTKVVRVLQYLEARINSMISIWGLDAKGMLDIHQEEGLAESVSDERPDSHLLNGPQLEGNGLGQENVDELLGGFDAPQTDPGADYAAAGDAELGQDNIDALMEEFASVFNEDEPVEEAAPVAEQAENNEEDYSLEPGETIDEDQLKALFS